ncbi:MAG: polysaccharide deacetylase family protein [Saprospiraceae bacterium]
MKKLIFLYFVCLFSCNEITHSKKEIATESQPTISFTFDDGITYGILNYPFKEWNLMILKSLGDENLTSVFFVTGVNKLDERGQFLLNSWNEKGHRIANHTFTHPNYNSKNVSMEDFQEEFLKTDSIINSLENHIPLFRFPYLKEGNDSLKIATFREFLKNRNYKNGYVTIDASDWYVNSRMIKKLKKDPKFDLEKFKKFYLDHLLDRANYYEQLSFEMHGRHIPHTILLHHNLTSALFLDDLMNHFKENGWKLINADIAFADSIYNAIPNNIPAGESLIWAQAKESGKYENQLRYPAEDSRYEESKMDSLGL